MQDERIQIGILLCYYLGLDAERIVSLRRGQLQLGRGWVGLKEAPPAKSETLPGQGEASPEQRIVSEAFLLPESAELFARALAVSSTHRDESSWLVPSHNPALRNAPMSASALRRKVADESQRVGQHVDCHQLQLSGAVEAIRKGESKKKVLERLGRKTWRSELTRAAMVVHREDTGARE